MLRKSRVDIFDDIIKIVIIFIKTIFKDSKKVKRLKYYSWRRNLYLHFLIPQKFLIPDKKILMSAEVKGVSRDSHIFWILFK